jgi:hypothetical protein
MKKLAAILLVAGLGGCVSPQTGNTQPVPKGFGVAQRGKEVPGVVGPMGEPVMMTAAADKAGKTGKKDPAVIQAQATMPAGPAMMPTTVKGDPAVMQTAGFAHIMGHGGCSDCSNGSVHLPGMAGGGFGYGGGGSIGMGPPGAVAAYGAWGGPGMGMGPMYPGQRTSIKFLSPQGMKVTWLGPTGYVEPGLTAQASYNFAQGNVYRLRLSGIPTRPGKTYYPTLELTHATPKTIEFLSHNTVPVGFTDEDFAQVAAGNLVTKVIYLPDPAFADLAVGGAEELVSTKLEPGADPVVEANRRGTILAVVRLGNIDLENPYSPAMDAPPAGMMPPVMAPVPGGPGMMPPPVQRVPAPTTPTPVPPRKSSTPVSLPTMSK